MGTATAASQSILDGLSERLGLGIVLCDDSDTIVWTNDRIHQEFPRVFPLGQTFAERFDDVTSTEPSALSESGEGAILERTMTAGEVRRLEPSGERPTYYRHVQFELPAMDGGRPQRVHCLVDITSEKRLEETFLNNLYQLTSMKEIVDLLYESRSTQEVLYLILVAVTSQLGFGFNRAFYLEARGKRLRGKIGIGPSSVEDAHRIWSRLDRLNLPTLRSLYNDLLSRNGMPPDPHTQEIAVRMDLAIRSSPDGLLGAIEKREPALIPKSKPCSVVDTTLFEILDTDAVAVVPLYVAESLAGVLIADNFITRKRITEHDLNLLKTFSGYAGVALQRSQLHDELRESVAKAQSANEELRRHQRKLLQAEKLSAIGELAACVSHEIRNPLVSIGGLARSLLKVDALDEDSKDSLGIIVDEVSRLEKFLSETLDFVKPEVAATHSLDIRSEVESVLASLRNELSEKSISVERDLGERPLVCRIDRDLFHRALTNLVKNSIEALNEGGEIHVKAKRRDYSARLSIADTGPGIPAEHRGRVFEPFFTTKPEGTGLGLAIASQSIRSLGGRISLQGNERFKTIFHIILPLEELSTRGSGEKKSKSPKKGMRHEDRSRC